MVDDGAGAVVVGESDTRPTPVHLLVLLAGTGVKARNAILPTLIPLRMLLPVHIPVPVPARPLAEDGPPPTPDLLPDADDTRPRHRVPARLRQDDAPTRARLPILIRGRRLDAWQSSERRRAGARRRRRGDTTGRAGIEIGMRGRMVDEMTGLGDMEGMAEMDGM